MNAKHSSTEQGSDDEESRKKSREESDDHSSDENKVKYMLCCDDACLSPTATPAPFVFFVNGSAYMSLVCVNCVHVCV